MALDTRFPAGMTTPALFVYNEERTGLGMQPVETQSCVSITAARHAERPQRYFPGEPWERYN
jgi:hypothetical protein